MRVRAGLGAGFQGAAAPPRLRPSLRVLGRERLRRRAPPPSAPHLRGAGAAAGPRTIFYGGGGAGCRDRYCRRGGGAHLGRGGAVVPCGQGCSPGPAFPSAQVRDVRSDRANFLRAYGRRSSPSTEPSRGPRPPEAWARPRGAQGECRGATPRPPASSRPRLTPRSPLPPHRALLLLLPVLLLCLRAEPASAVSAAGCPAAPRR